MPKNKMDSLKLGKATLIAPLMAPLMYLVGVSLFGVGPDGVKDALLLFLLISIYALPVGYASVIVVGLPIVLLLKRNKALNARNMSISGLLAGGVVFLVTMYVMSQQNMDVLVPPQLLWYLGAGGAIGISVAYTFSIIAGITKPFSGRSR